MGSDLKHGVSPSTGTTKAVKPEFELEKRLGQHVWHDHLSTQCQDCEWNASENHRMIRASLVVHLNTVVRSPIYAE